MRPAAIRSRGASSSMASMPASAQKASKDSAVGSTEGLTLKSWLAGANLSKPQATKTGPRQSSPEPKPAV